MAAPHESSGAKLEPLPPQRPSMILGALPSHQRFFSRFNIGDLVATSQEVIQATQDTTVQEAINTMAGRNILSLPVYNTQTKKYVGMVSLFELISVIAFQSLFSDSDGKEGEANIMEDESSQHLFDQPLADFIDTSDGSFSIHVFEADGDFRDLLKVFAQGVHRVLVRFQGRTTVPMGGSGNVAELLSDPDKPALPIVKLSYVRVLSQTDVVRFLHANAHHDDLREAMSRTVESLGLSGKQVVTINASSTALTGFQKMSLHNVSALAVVDDRGRLVASLAASDIRGTTKVNFSRCTKPILEFLACAPNPRGNDLVKCDPADTLGKVTESILQAHSHRAFVVDKAGKPIGVVSLTDILRVFSPPGLMERHKETMQSYGSLPTEDDSNDEDGS